MDKNTPEKMFEYNVAILQNFGIHYVNQVHAVLQMLQSYREGKVQLSEEELNQLYRIGIYVSEKHQ